MIKVPRNLPSQVRLPKGYKKLLKEISENPLSPNKLITDEIKEISLQHEITLIKSSTSEIASFWYQKEAPYKECTANVIALSKITGHGIAFSPENNRFIEIPFAMPGDSVVVALKRHYDYFIEGKLIEVVHPSMKKVNAKCKYFGKCRGCQLQELPYSQQLQYKKDIVKFAYRNQFQPDNFDSLIQDTVESPLQYNYRTKITPHYGKYSKRNPIFNIGFNDLENRILDVDYCAIATNTVNMGFKEERERVKKFDPEVASGTLGIREHQESGKDSKIFKTGARDLITERVNDKTFQFPIYTFFQNNNSILPIVLKFIESHLSTKYNTLIDTYCGSGFFSISLSNFFQRSIGIEISTKSIEYAKINSTLNNLSNVTFISGTASNIFNEIDSVNSNETCILIDPSRKGSTIDFLQQLADFRPGLIVYVSCNVYSQSRDLYDFLKKLNMEKHYRVKDIRGFDFFPQTKHVETVAVLELIN